MSKELDEIEFKRLVGRTEREAFNEAFKKKEGIKHDQGKLRYELLVPEFLEEMAKIISHGAEKYGDWNWTEVEGARQRYEGALLRHIQAWRKGEILNEEENKNKEKFYFHHTAHIAINAMFLHCLDTKKK